jgi:site-specific DNA recombinase
MTDSADEKTRVRIIAYTRVSTDQQAEEGVSLEVQRQKLAAYAQAMDLELVASIEDAGESARSLERPGLKRALAMLDAREADGILVTKLDRLTRSVRDLGGLVEKYFADRPSCGRSCALISLAESIDTRTAGGRLVLHVLGSVAQWEREVIGERTRDSLQHLKRLGKRLGQRPLRLIHPESARAAWDLYATGDYTHKELADELNHRKVPTARAGGRWHPTTVRRALRQVVAA